MTPLDPRADLGAFLRAHRERLPPPAEAGRRRTPGWRREEVAQASGVSVTWITWLEQGRDVSASPQALARLAETLRLAPAERAYLFELAGKRDPAAPKSDEDELPATVVDLPGRISGPAYVLDGHWTARAWNDAAEALFTGWLDGDHDRNLLRFIFLSAEAPRLIDDWEERARRVVAEFRADFSRALHDPVNRALIEDLSAKAPIFEAMWRDQQVLAREGGERRFKNPARHFYQSTLIFAAHPEIKLVCLIPGDA